MTRHRIHGPALFTSEEVAFYDAALAHNRAFAKPEPWETTLSESDEADFRAWVKANEVDFDPDAAVNQYDMRGYWKHDLSAGTRTIHGVIHYPDTYKTPRNTAFSNQSRYAVPGCPFKWRGEILVDVRDGQVIYNDENRYPMTGSVDDELFGISRREVAPAAPGEGDALLNRRRKQKHAPLLPRIQGIRSSIFDITLRGDKFVDRIGGALLDGTLVRKIGGASELKLEIEDAGAKLLNSGLLDSAYTLQLDGLGFSYVAYERNGLLGPLLLTHEAEVVHRLRQLHGPHKAFRDQMTRAEFAKARVMELKPPRPRFVSPELHVVQPIRTERDARKRTQEAKEERGKGLNRRGLKVKGQTPSEGQYELGEMALSIAESLGAPSAVMTMVIMALIDETDMGAVQRGNVLAALEPFTKVRNAAEEIAAFISGTPTWTGTSAMAEYKKDPTEKLSMLVQRVQKSGTPDGSNYAAFEAESKQWVEAWGGGAEGALQPQRYAFEEKKDEDHWKCLQELAKPVNWRAFESAGWIYFIAEPSLLASVQRMVISDSTPGVIDTSIKGDSGKPHEEVTVEAMAKEWAAPPGSAVLLKRHGPADGVYLVDRIEAPLARRESLCQIQLKRPSKPKKEPAPQKKSPTGAKFGKGETTPTIEAAFTVEGVQTWDNGITVAKWIIPALEWAKEHGGNTDITSGYRPGIDPHTATGTSEHQGTKYPHGAIDFGGFVDPTGKAHRESFLDCLEKTAYPGPMLKRPIGFSDDGHCSGTGH